MDKKNLKIARRLVRMAKELLAVSNYEQDITVIDQIKVRQDIMQNRDAVIAATIAWSDFVNDMTQNGGMNAVRNAGNVIAIMNATQYGGWNKPHSKFHKAIHQSVQAVLDYCGKWIFKFPHLTYGDMDNQASTSSQVGDVRNILKAYTRPIMPYMAAIHQAYTLATIDPSKCIEKPIWDVLGMDKDFYDALVNANDGLITKWIKAVEDYNSENAQNGIPDRLQWRIEGGQMRALKNEHNALKAEQSRKLLAGVTRPQIRQSADFVVAKLTETEKNFKSFLLHLKKADDVANGMITAYGDFTSIVNAPQFIATARQLYPNLNNLFLPASGDDDRDLDEMLSNRGDRIVRQRGTNPAAGPFNPPSSVVGSRSVRRTAGLFGDIWEKAKGLWDSFTGALKRLLGSFKTGSDQIKQELSQAQEDGQKVLDALSELGIDLTGASAGDQS